jgi:hypothetical protein
MCGTAKLAGVNIDRAVERVHARRRGRPPLADDTERITMRIPARVGRQLTNASVPRAEPRRMWLAAFSLTAYHDQLG